MSQLDNTLIKCIDRWQRPIYLKEDLTFTDIKEEACKFQLLNSKNKIVIDCINI